MEEQNNNESAVEELPRCKPKILTERLSLILEELHSKLNGESEKHTLPVILTFSEEIPFLSREKRKNYLEEQNPDIFNYLQSKNIAFVHLGYTSGKIIVNTTLKQLDNLKNFNKLKEIDYALKIDHKSDNFEAYLKIFKPK